MAFLPEMTWYNIVLIAYFGASAVPAFLGQSEAEKGPVVWSKFAIGRELKTPVSARTGMLVKYVPSIALCAIRPLLGYSPNLLTWLVLLQFVKRAGEVLVVHDFSGSPKEDFQSSAFIGLFYTLVAWSYFNGGVGSSGLPLYLGVGLFAAGTAGNLYHHVLLARLRAPAARRAGLVTDASGKYVVPEGGLFDLVACPHYFFECLAFWGLAIVAATLLPVLCATNTTLMLAGQASSTTRWYVGRFGDRWPAERKHMIPYVY